MDGNRMGNEEIEIDLGELFRLLVQNVFIIAATALLAATLGMFACKFFVTPTYSSTTKVYILNKQNSSSVSYSDIQMGTQLTKDYQQMVQSRFVLEEVIQELNLDITYENLNGKLNVSTPSDTRILSITVTDTNPVAAMKIANAVREVAAAHITDVMDIEAVNVVETANLPMKKAGPDLKKWILVSGALGAFMVCGIIIIIYLLNDTIKSSEDVEKYLQISTLALIPVEQSEEETQKSKAKRKRQRQMKHLLHKLTFTKTEG